MARPAAAARARSASAGRPSREAAAPLTLATHAAADPGPHAAAGRSGRRRPATCAAAAAAAAEPPPCRPLPPRTPQLPADLPEECPFPVEWHELLTVVVASEGVDAAALAGAVPKLAESARVISLNDLSARLAAEDPLNAAIDELRGGKGEMPAALDASLVVPLLRTKFDRDAKIEWKFEVVRRRAAVAAAEEAQAAAGAAAGAAAAALADAQAKLAPLAAQLAAKGPSKLLSWRMTEAEKLVADASGAAEAAAAAVAVADERHAAAVGAMADKLIHYQPYWVSDLYAGLEDLRGLAAAGVVLRTLVWAYAPGPDGAAPEAPETFAALRAAGAEVRWGTPLGDLALVELPLGGPAAEASVFMAPPPGSQVLTPVVRPRTAEPEPAASAKGKPPAKGAPPPPPAAPEDVPGAMALARVMLTAKERATEYELWRARASIFDLPALGPVNTRLYDSLMEARRAPLPPPRAPRPRPPPTRGRPQRRPARPRR